MNNRIDQLFQDKKDVLSVYFTAGYPQLEDTLPILQSLEKAGVGMVELGFPFSDPLADGPVIQQSSVVAIENGISAKKIFEQTENLRNTVSIPVVAMGYTNTVLQYGFESFLQELQKRGIDGLILPDLPPNEYKEKYEALYIKYGVHAIFLITPQTSEERIRYIDSISRGFIYMVSTASTTGAQSSFEDATSAYFKRVAEMNLNNPLVVGFGISNKETFQKATAHANGAIVGSAFIKALNGGFTEKKVSDFVSGILN